MINERKLNINPKGDVSVVVHLLIASIVCGRFVMVLCFMVYLLLSFLVLQSSC